MALHEAQLATLRAVLEELARPDLPRAPVLAPAHGGDGNAGGGGGSSGGGQNSMHCHCCGRWTSQDQWQKKGFLMRARTFTTAVECVQCAEQGRRFLICGECFNTRSYQHPEDHMLVLYPSASETQEGSATFSSRRGAAPPPPGRPGSRPGRW